MSLGNMCRGTLMSVPPPFYPTEALQKGATPSQVCEKRIIMEYPTKYHACMQYGFVFGIYYLAALLFSPFFAAYTPRLGTKGVFIAGGLLQGVFGGLLFAMLDDVDDTMTFIYLSYLCRFMSGAGNSATFCAGSGMVLSQVHASCNVVCEWHVQYYHSCSFQREPHPWSLLWRASWDWDICWVNQKRCSRFTLHKSSICRPRGWHHPLRPRRLQAPVPGRWLGRPLLRLPRMLPAQPQERGWNEED